MRYPDAERYVDTKKVSRGTNRKRFGVFHYTAGSSYEGDIRILSTARAKVSCHFVVGPDGSVAQIGDLNDIQWHAGRSKWKGINGLNKYSIGIEITNPGIMERNSKTTFITHFGKIYNEKDLVVRGNYAWLPYNPEQLIAVEELCEWLIDVCPNLEEFVGHEDIAPGRKVDPANGIIFPQALYDRLNRQIKTGDYTRKTDEDDDTHVVSTSSGTLNIRASASTKGKRVGSMPNRQSFTSLKQSKGWHYLDEDGNKGWVYGKFVKEL